MASDDCYDKKPKINIVVGGTFHFPLLARHLQELNYDVMIYTSTPRFKFKNEIFFKNVRVTLKPFQLIGKIFGWSTPRWADAVDEIFFDLLVTLRMRKADILIGFQNASLFSGQKIKKAGGIFLLDRACPHAGEVTERLFEAANVIGLNFKKPLKIQMDRYEAEYSLCDRVIVPSNYSRDSFLKMGFNQKKLIKIPLSAKIEIANTIPELPSGLVIGVAGTDILRKGIYYLLKAFDTANLSTAKLLLKTDKSQVIKNAELREIVERNPNIEFCGYFPNMNDFYSLCSVFCLPSIDDGFGMVLCEAMANGRAVIATDTTGASEFIIDGENGFVIPSGDEESLCRTFKYFDKHPEKRLEMGKNARRHYIAYENSKLNYRERLKDVIETFL